MVRREGGGRREDEGGGREEEGKRRRGERRKREREEGDSLNEEKTLRFIIFRFGKSSFAHCQAMLYSKIPGGEEANLQTNPAPHKNWYLFRYIIFDVPGSNLTFEERIAEMLEKVDLDNTTVVSSRKKREKRKRKRKKGEKLTTIDINCIYDTCRMAGNE